MSEKVTSVIKHTVCLSCKSKMQHIDVTLKCPECGNVYGIENSVIIVVPGNDEKVIDPLDKIKLLLKPFAKLYSLLIKIISPVYVDGTLSTFIKCNVKKGNLYLNLGSGNIRIHPDVVNVDFIAYPNVDMVADISSVPLEDESCDGIFIIGVLEHVPDPCKVIREIHRLLKKNSFVYAFFPFMQGYHASPHDYFRTTQEGIKILFKEFEIIELKRAGGPTSGFLWVFQEWLAMILSVGIKPLYYFWYLLLMCLTFPIKFFDILLIHHPMAGNITSGFIIIAKK